MDLLKEFIRPKCFNPYSYFVVICSLVFGIILFGVVTDVETNEERYSFTCRMKGEEKQYFKAHCFADYQAETTKGFPLYGFVLLYFLLVAMVTLLYSLSVKSRIESLESPDTEIIPLNQDVNSRIEYQESQDDQRLIIQPNQSCFLYCGYCIQLAIRFTLGMTFLILEWGVLYPLKFPAEYSCDLSRIHQVKPLNTTSSPGNVTQFLYDCFNPQAGKKTFWILVIFAVILLFTILTFVELIYVMIKARVCENFKKDLEFFKMHLKNKIETTENGTNTTNSVAAENNAFDVENSVEESWTNPTNIVDNSSETTREGNNAVGVDNSAEENIVKDYVTQMKETIKERTEFYEPLLPNIPGKEGKLELDKIYTKLIVCHHNEPQQKIFWNSRVHSC